MAGIVTSKASRTATVEIDSIGSGGEGVGRMDDGRVVFVHRTAPGDLARIRLDRSARRWARGSLVSLERASELRRTPPCPHFERCGGCPLEHLQYPAQLEAKARMVRDALQRIGKIEIQLPEVVASPEEFQYRNRVSFTLRRVGGGRVVAGFHEIGSPTRIVDITEACLLPELPIARGWGALRRGWGEGASLLPPGDELRLTLRATAEGTVSLLVQGERAGGDAEQLLAEVPELSAVWIDIGDGPRLAAGQTSLRESWGEMEIEFSGAAFLQVNRGAARLLEDHVVAVAGEVGGMHVIDAYCGAGFHAARLADRGARVTGIELDPDAIRAAREICGPGVDLVEARVEAVLADRLPADLVIANPPRGGLDAEASAAIAAQPPARMIYISCDPATLARDLQRLNDAMQVTGVRSFDLFPQTAHVESVVTLARIANVANEEDA